MFSIEILEKYRKKYKEKNRVICSLENELT